MRHEILDQANGQHHCTIDLTMENHDHPMNNPVHGMYWAHFRHHAVKNLDM